MLRSEIRAVVACDIFSNPPLETEPNELFDVVSACFCLEACVSTLSDYKKVVGKLAMLIKPGGFCIGLMSEEES